MKQPKEMTAEERVAHWGFDPLAGLQYIGVSAGTYRYDHRELSGAKGRFEFFYDHVTGEIDVCHHLCNIPIFAGKQLPDGTTTFNPPKGYPDSEIFTKEFRVLRDAFLEKLQASTNRSVTTTK